MQIPTQSQQSPGFTAAAKQTSTNKHNARQLYLDMVWYGILAGSALAFLAIYAVRLGATGLQVGLLTAGPAVVSLLVSLPAARVLEGRSLLRATFLSSVWFRMGYVAVVFLPVLFAEHIQTWVLPAVIVLMSVPGTVLAISFNAMFADVVPPEGRARVVGRRNALLAVSMMTTILFSGWLLDSVVFPLNYQIVFALGLVGAGMSSYYLSRLRPMDGGPVRVGRPLFDRAGPGLLRFGDSVRVGAGLRFLRHGSASRLLRVDLLRGPFGLFLLVLFVFYTAQFAPVPVMPLVLVRALNLSDSAISIGTALFHGATLLVSMRLHWLSARFSHQRLLSFSALLYGLHPLIIGLAGNAVLYWVASVVGGAVSGLVAGALVTRLMERVPAGDRPAHMALFSLALNLGVLFGSLLGPALGDWLGLREALLITAGLRLLSGLLIVVWG